MHPDVPESKVLDNPYTYTSFRSDRPTAADSRPGRTAPATSRSTSR